MQLMPGETPCRAFVTPTGPFLPVASMLLILHSLILAPGHLLSCRGYPRTVVFRHPLLTCRQHIFSRSFSVLTAWDPTGSSCLAIPRQMGNFAKLWKSFEISIVPHGVSLQNWQESTKWRVLHPPITSVMIRLWKKKCGKPLLSVCVYLSSLLFLCIALCTWLEPLITPGCDGTDSEIKHQEQVGQPGPTIEDEGCNQVYRCHMPRVQATELKLLISSGCPCSSCLFSFLSLPYRHLIYPLYVVTDACFCIDFAEHECCG